MNSDTAPIYAVVSNDSSEMTRGFQIALLGIHVDELQQATYNGEGDDSSWKMWVENLFRPVLMPTFTAVYEAAAAMRHEDIARLDHELSAQLTAEACERSIAASAPFRESKAQVRHMPQWVRFEEKLNLERTPGHFATLFAIQSALFNVPVLTALFSYASAEWIGASPDNRELPDSALAIIQPHLKQAATGGLRSI